MHFKSGDDGGRAAPDALPVSWAAEPSSGAHSDGSPSGPPTAHSPRVSWLRTAGKEPGPVVGVMTEPQPPSVHSMPRLAEAKLPFLAPTSALTLETRTGPGAQRSLQGLPGTAVGPQGGAWRDRLGSPTEPPTSGPHTQRFSPD